MVRVIVVLLVVLFLLPSVDEWSQNGQSYCCTTSCPFFLPGLALDLPLLEWLQKYTFPTESRFQDIQYARSVYERAVDISLGHGTTSANYFATIHREASETLADVAEEKGQRALVGKVCMNRNGFSGYVEQTADSLNDTRLFVTGLLGRKSDLVDPVVTPRFVPTCDQELMLGLGEIAKTYDVRVHSHLAETVPEVNEQIKNKLA